jgi:hypothetical protein
MVWIVGAICMIFFGGGMGVIGLLFGMLGFAILGGILALCGLFLLVSIGRQSDYWWANWWAKRT